MSPALEHIVSIAIGALLGVYSYARLVMAELVRTRETLIKLHSAVVEIHIDAGLGALGTKPEFGCEPTPVERKVQK